MSAFGARDQLGKHMATGAQEPLFFPHPAPKRMSVSQLFGPAGWGELHPGMAVLVWVQLGCC